MKFITRDTDYAVRALVFMAEALKKNKEKKLITVEEIAEELDLPLRFLRRILQRLAKKDILNSYKGKEGGFSFKKSPDKIRFNEIMAILQGRINIINCLLRRKICPDLKECKLKERLKSVGSIVEEEFGRITIKSLLLGRSGYGKKKNYKNRCRKM